MAYLYTETIQCSETSLYPIVGAMILLVTLYAIVTNANIDVDKLYPRVFLERRSRRHSDPCLRYKEQSVNKEEEKEEEIIEMKTTKIPRTDRVGSYYSCELTTREGHVIFNLDTEEHLVKFISDDLPTIIKDMKTPTTYSK